MAVKICVKYIISSIDKALSLFWLSAWLWWGLAILYIWYKSYPQLAAMLLPLYFLLWIGVLPLGRILIKYIAKYTICLFIGENTSITTIVESSRVSQVIAGGGIVSKSLDIRNWPQGYFRLKSVLNVRGSALEHLFFTTRGKILKGQSIYYIDLTIPNIEEVHGGWLRYDLAQESSHYETLIHDRTHIEIPESFNRQNIFSDLEDIVDVYGLAKNPYKSPLFEGINIFRGFHAISNEYADLSALGKPIEATIDINLEQNIMKYRFVFPVEKPSIIKMQSIPRNISLFKSLEPQPILQGVCIA